MDLIKAVSIIGRDLEEALALLDQLSTIKSTHTAEIELTRSRIRSASELLRLLPALERPEEPATINTQEPKKTQEEVRPPEMEEKMKTEPAAKMKIEVTEKIKTEVAEKVKTEPAGETAAENFAGKEPHRNREPMQQPVTEQVNETERMHETMKAPEALKSILADRFASTGTIGEKMQSEKHDGVISSVMHSKPIADIATAIGMNDKFYFIRELFSGDSIAYHDTIRRLNAAASLGEAMRILDESTVMGSDPAAQSSFVDVVRRKFNLHV